MHRPELLPDGLRLHLAEAAETMLRISLTQPRRTRLAGGWSLAALRQAPVKGFSEDARQRLGRMQRL